jgi:hypothetical protein
MFLYKGTYYFTMAALMDAIRYDIHQDNLLRGNQ